MRSAVRPSSLAAMEREPVAPVAGDGADATWPYLLKSVVAMVQVRRLRRCRPQGVCRMPTSDIDRSRFTDTSRNRSCCRSMLRGEKQSKKRGQVLDLDQPAQ